MHIYYGIILWYSLRRCGSRCRDADTSKNAEKRQNTIKTIKILGFGRVLLIFDVCAGILLTIWVNAPAHTAA